MKRTSLEAKFSPDPLLTWNPSRWLERFLPVWAEARKNVPRWARSDVPERLSSYADFCEVPLMRREELQNDLSSFLSGNQRETEMACTGGSTGKPLRFPLYKSELEIGRTHQILARRQYGVEPGDRCQLIWGHAAHLEVGWRALGEKISRYCKDSLMGYRRISAYRLTDDILREAFNRMLRFRPAWIYAYSSSLLAFVRANSERTAEARRLQLKLALGAAEPMDSRAACEISSYFGCPVGMEYGSVEMRVCAHTHPGFNGYYVFTDDYLLEALPTEKEHIFDLAVTKLYRSAMPLIRYLVGDQIVVRQNGFHGGPLTCFDEVYGRTNDNLKMKDGAEVHSETITHAVRSEADILAYQLHQFPSHFEIHLVTRGCDLPEEVKARIRARLSRVHPDLSELVFKQVPDLITTSAGKRRWVLRHG